LSEWIYVAIPSGLIEDVDMNAVIYTDASIGRPPRPAPAGAGYVIIFEREGIWETVPGARALGLLRTPQEAEYHAALWALRAAVLGQFSTVVLRTDSKPLVDQMNGSARVLGAALPLAKRLRALVSRFDAVEFQWVGRSHNKSADLLAELGRSRNK
jgi:probable phosphoglycerate mutase